MARERNAMYTNQHQLQFNFTGASFHVQSRHIISYQIITLGATHTKPAYGTLRFITPTTQNQQAHLVSYNWKPTTYRNERAHEGAMSVRLRLDYRGNKHCTRSFVIEERSFFSPYCCCYLIIFACRPPQESSTRVTEIGSPIGRNRYKLFPGGGGWGLRMPTRVYSCVPCSMITKRNPDRPSATIAPRGISFIHSFAPPKQPR